MNLEAAFAQAKRRGSPVFLTDGLGELKAILLPPDYAPIVHSSGSFGPDGLELALKLFMPRRREGEDPQGGGTSPSSPRER